MTRVEGGATTGDASEADDDWGLGVVKAVQPSTGAATVHVFQLELDVTVPHHHVRALSFAGSVRGGAHSADGFRAQTRPVRWACLFAAGRCGRTWPLRGHARNWPTRGSCAPSTGTM